MTESDEPNKRYKRLNKQRMATEISNGLDSQLIFPLLQIKMYY